MKYFLATEGSNMEYGMDKRWEANLYRDFRLHWIDWNKSWQSSTATLQMMRFFSVDTELKSINATNHTFHFFKILTIKIMKTKQGNPEKDTESMYASLDSLFLLLNILKYCKLLPLFLVKHQNLLVRSYS